jgi:hypothetical protein
MSVETLHKPAAVTENPENTPETQLQRRNRENGRLIESPPLLTEIKKRIVELRARGDGWNEIAAALHVSRMTLYLWRRSDPELVRALQEATEAGTDALEDALHRGAMQVASEPKYTTAAIFTLKNRRPGVWQDRAPAPAVQVTLNLSELPQDEINRLRHAIRPVAIEAREEREGIPGESCQDPG